MKKKFLALLLAALMVVSLMPTVAFATGPSGTALTAVGGTLNGGSYYLNTDITLTNNLTVNGEVTLDLNGYVLRGNGNNSVITVNSGATLTLEDSNPTAVHKFSDSNGLWVWNDTLEGDAVKYTVTGGVITGGTGCNRSNYYYGGGVLVNSGGTFTMNAGSVTGNLASGGGGGGVSVDSGGTFTMNAGSVTGNFTSGGGGGMKISGTFTMNGGSITGNTAKTYGGGMFVNNNSTVTLGGSPVIRGNKTTGGSDAINESNIHLQDSSKNILKVSSEKPLNSGADIGVTVWLNSGWGPGAEAGSYLGGTMTDENCKYFVMNNSGPSNRGVMYGLAKQSSNYVLTLPTYRVTAQVQGDHGTAKVEIDSTAVTEATENASVVFTAEPNTGYKFDHWEVVSGGVNIEATKTNNPITVTMPGEALTLKAHYKPITYTVSFNGNGSSGGNTSFQTMTYDVAAKLNPNGFTAPDGRQFAGWAESNTENDPTYADGELVKNLAATEGTEITLYAVWREASDYTVVFYLLDEGSDGAGTVSKKVDIWRPSNTEENPQGSTATANEGYFFKGWKDAEGHFITQSDNDYYTLDGQTIKPKQTSTIDTNYTAVFAPFVTVSGVSMNKTDFTYGDAVGYTGTPVAKTIEGLDVTTSIEDWEYRYFQNKGTAEAPNWGLLNSTPTDLGSYKLVVKACDNEKDYQGNLELPFTIGKRAVTVSDIAVQDKNYNGKTDAAVIVLDNVSFTGKLDADELTISGITGTYASANASDTQTVNLNDSSAWTLGGRSAANYMLATEGQPTSVTGKISKATPTLTGVQATAITYGQTLADSTVTGTATNENKTSDKTVEGTFAFTTGDTTPAVSDSENTTYGVTFTPTDGTNYNTSTTKIKLKVNKADYAEVIKTASGNLNAKKDSTAEITLPSKPINTSYGTVTNNNTALYTINETNKASGKLTLTAAKDFDKTTESGDTTFTVAVEPDGNHNGYDITVTVTPTFKEPVSIIAEADGFTYGDSAKTGYKNVTVQDSLVDVNAIEATYYFADGTTKTNTTEGASVEGGMPANAGTYKVVLSVPDSNETYTGSKIVEFTIAKKAITIKPKDKSAYVGDTTPVLGPDDYTVTGLVNGDTLTLAPTLSYATETDMTKAGTIAIEASGADAGANYQISYQDGTLTISNKSSGVFIDRGVSNYSVAAESAKNGTVTVDKSSVAADGTVTITVAPDKGFVLEALTVLDANGKEVEVNNLGNNKYSFTMPKSNVSVKASFVKEQTVVNSFVDVKEGDYFYDAVLWAIENGITDGVDATHFNPSGITNRAQMVTFLWRAAGCPEPTLTACPFADVESGSYYDKAVLWAYENGITGGTSATTFDPNMNVNRAQVVTFLWRYSGGLSVDYWMQMSDVASGEYYSEAVRWALAEKITDGTSKTTFSPEDDCLRGQAVTFLYRGFGK